MPFGADWYSNRKGIGHLYSREWIDVKNVDMTSDIAEVQGRVVYVDEENANHGYHTPLSMESAYISHIQTNGYMSYTILDVLYSFLQFCPNV